MTDGTATPSDEEHDATLIGMSATFAAVVDTAHANGLTEA